MLRRVSSAVPGVADLAVGVPGVEQAPQLGVSVLGDVLRRAVPSEPHWSGDSFVFGPNRDKGGMEHHQSPPDPALLELVRRTVEECMNAINYFGQPIRIGTVTRRDFERYVRRMPSPERELCLRLMAGDSSGAARLCPPQGLPSCDAVLLLPATKSAS